MNKIIKFLDNTFLDLGRQFKWTYLPPLMVYMAAGISGLTGILLIVVTVLTLVLPIIFVFIINNSKYKTSE